MKGNRQIGLDGRIFINDCLSDGIFFVYSIILSGILGAVGDVMKLTGKSGGVMDSLTNGLIIMDLACCLGLILVSYYIYFMNCGENMPRFGVKPLIYLEYIRLAYYGMLIYDILYRFSDEILHSGTYPVAMSVFYAVYLGWLVACSFAAMFILTVLNQNMIRRSYSDSFKMLALIGLGINIVMPLVFFITKVWIKGSGDGFYSSGLCDFIRLGIAPMFYAALWFLFLNAIDQVDRVFSEVDNAIRDKNYRIEFEEENGKGARKKKKANKVSKDKTDKEPGKDKAGKKSKNKNKEAASDTENTDGKKNQADGETSVQQEDTSVPPVSPDIAFETGNESDDDIGGVVDINMFFEGRNDYAQSDASQKPAESDGSSDEKQSSETAEENK